jgi:hypothetical protein
VGDLATLQTNDGLPSPEAALRFAQDIERKGGRPAVGLLGVPLAWASRYGVPPLKLFDACTNIAVGTAALDGYRAQCDVHRPNARRSRRHPTLLGAESHAPRDQVRRCILTEFGQELGFSTKPSAVLAQLVPTAARTSRSDRGDDQPSASSPVFREPPASGVAGSGIGDVFFSDRATSIVAPTVRSGD